LEGASSKKRAQASGDTIVAWLKMGNSLQRRWGATGARLDEGKDGVCLNRS